MAQPVYSVRFLNAGPAAGTYTYTVPAGMRAVVKFIAHTNFSATLAGMNCRIAGAAFFYSELPGSTYNRFSDVRGVAYAGETVSVVLDHQDTYAHVSGFLFAAGVAQVAGEEGYTDELLPPAPDPAKRPSP